MKKLVTERSLEELVDTLDSEDSPEGEQIYDEVLKFVAEYNLTPGNEEVPGTILYRLFKKRYKSGLSRLAFTKRMNELFVARDTGPKRYYYKLNRSAFNLSNEAYKILEAKKVRLFTHTTVKTQFEKFMADCKLKQGKHFVPSYVVYFMYDEWCFNNKKPTRISGRAFSDFSKLYFERKNPRLGDIYYFGIDYESVKDYLTPERMKIIDNWGSKIYGKKRKHTKRKKSNPKVKKEVSGT